MIARLKQLRGFCSRATAFERSAALERSHRKRLCEFQQHERVPQLFLVAGLR
jgi:hypothetical protein